jgi:hypothetical protein
MSSVTIPSGDVGVEYRLIEGHDGYAVGDDGSVWSHWQIGRWRKRLATWKRMTPTIHKHGYPYVNLGKSCRKYVHQLVAVAFIGPCPDGQEVRHWDGNTSNCCAGNLLYGTRSDNCKDTVRHGRCCFVGRSYRGSMNPTAIIDEAIASVIKGRLSGGERQVDIAADLGITPAIVGFIKRGKTWKHVAQPGSDLASTVAPAAAAV